MEKVQKPCVGTTMKINVSAELGNNNHLGDACVGIECVFYCSDEKKKSQTVTKDEMIKVDDDNYIAIVYTSLLGEGYIKMKLTVTIPDMDFPEGVRVEVVRVDTGIPVSR